MQQLEASFKQNYKLGNATGGQPYNNINRSLYVNNFENTNPYIRNMFMSNNIQNTFESELRRTGNNKSLSHREYEYGNYEYRK